MWLPTIKDTIENSAAAVSALLHYQQSEVGTPATQASSPIKSKKTFFFKYNFMANHIRIFLNMEIFERFWIETLKLAKRSRAVSLYAERLPENDKKEITMEDLHAEMMSKLSAPNRGLKNAGERKLREPEPKEIPIWLKIFEQSRATKRCQTDPTKLSRHFSQLLYPFISTDHWFLEIIEKPSNCFIRIITNNNE